MDFFKYNKYKGEEFMKTIYLDMDGTCANLYEVIDWLKYIQEEDVFPYLNAELLLDETEINFLKKWIAEGNQVSIISWTSKGGTREYNKRVRAAKIKWLKANLPLPYAEIHIVKYGTPKSKFGKDGDILVDDEIRNLIEWKRNGRRIALSPIDFTLYCKNK